MSEGFAALAAAEGQPGRAALLWGAAETLRQSIGAPRPPCECPEYDRNVASVRAALGAGPFAAAEAEGHALSLERTIAAASGGGAEIR